MFGVRFDDGRARDFSAEQCFDVGNDRFEDLRVGFGDVGLQQQMANDLAPDVVGGGAVANGLLASV